MDLSFISVVNTIGYIFIIIVTGAMLYGLWIIGNARKKKE